MKTPASPERSGVSVPNRRICLLTHTWPPELGAAPLRWAATAEALAREGYELLVLTGMPNYPTGQIFPGYTGQWFSTERLPYGWLRRHWLFATHSTRWLARGWAMLSFALMLLRSMPHLLRFRPRWIMVQSPPILSPVVAVLLARLCGAGLIVNLSDLWPGAIADLGLMSRKGLFFRVLKAIERWIYRHARLCMVQSEEIMTGVRSVWPVECLLFRTGTEAGTFLPSAPGSRPGPRKVAYIGVMGAAQGLLDLCRSGCFEHARVELHLYGDGHEKQYIREWIAQNPGRNVFLHHALPHQEVPATLANYDAVLVAQKKRIFGTVPSKLYDGMAAGLPVLLLGEGEPTEIVERFGCGWSTPPSDYQQFGDLLTAFATAPSGQLQEMGERGRKAASAYFDRAVQQNKLAAWLRKQETDEKSVN